MEVQTFKSLIHLGQKRLFDLVFPLEIKMKKCCCWLGSVCVRTGDEGEVRIWSSHSAAV